MPRRRDEIPTVQIGLRVKEPLRAMLDESARARDISMNAEIVRRLERSFERHDHVIDGVKIGGELFKVLRDHSLLQRKIGDYLTSQQRDDAALAGAALDLSAASDRVANIWKAIQPADLGMTIEARGPAGDDATVVTRTIKDDES